jgi:cytochrome c553
MGTAYLNGKFEVYRTLSSAPVDETFSRLVHLGRAQRHAGLTAAGTTEMIGVAHAVSDDDSKAAIEWYVSQRPTPKKRPKVAATENGHRLYVDGLQENGVRPCQSCHGLEGEGTDTVPRLVGQNGTYLLRQLSLFRAGKRRDEPMMEVARKFEDDQIRALVGFLESR